MWWCHQLLNRFLANGQLPRMSRHSRLSTSDKGDNEIIPGDVHRSPCIYLIAKENSEKSQLGDRRWRLCDQSSHQMGSRISIWALQELKRKERRKGQNHFCVIRTLVLPHFMRYLLTATVKRDTSYYWWWAHCVSDKVCVPEGSLESCQRMSQESELHMTCVAARDR